jgi:hypothetical protein
VKDHREAIDDFSKLQVFVEAVRVKGRGPWLEIAPSTPSFDLTLYAAGGSVSVFQGEMESGPYEGLHLKFEKISGTIKKNGFSVDVKNGVGPIQLPFSLEPKRAALVVIDLKVLDLSDHHGRGYELHLNGYEVYRDGRLIDKVPPG